MLRPILLLVIGAIFMFLAVRRLRLHVLKERHAIVLILAALPMFVLALWPTLLDRAVELTGISHSTILLMGVCTFFIYMILELLSLVSKLDQDVSTLAQIIGIQNEREQGILTRNMIEQVSEPQAPVGDQDEQAEPNG